MNNIPSPSIQLSPAINHSDASQPRVEMQIARVCSTTFRTPSDTSLAPPTSKLEGDLNRASITSKLSELKESNTSPYRMKEIRKELIRAGAMTQNNDIDKQIKKMIKQRAKKPQGLSSTDNTLFASSAQGDRYPTGSSCPNGACSQDFDAERLQSFIPEYAIEKQNREDINSTRKGVRREVVPTIGSHPTTRLSHIPNEVYHSVREALTHHNEIPTIVQPERHQLQLHLQQEQQFYSSRKAQSNQVFPHCLRQVNDNLISHQHTSFPIQKAEGYKQLASEVYRGDRSNTSAFAESSAQWLDAFKNASTQRDKIDCAVGAGMNAGGALFAGVLDNNDYKTGKALHPAKK
ncbi:hypothetical protein ACB087_19625 [Vibrio sp. VNB-15]